MTRNEGGHGGVESGYPDRRLPRYSQLGQGGMGEVYLVENPQLERREALKVISVAGAGIPVSSSGSPMRRGPRPS